MIILHAGFHAKQLWLWGEAARSSEITTKGAKGRKKSAAAQLTRLPYDAGADGLAAALREIFPAAEVPSTDFKSPAVWLPTVDGRPTASSPLIAPASAAQAAPVAAPWSITALSMSTFEASELLGSCLDKELFAPGVVIGKDLAYWATALRFAGALTARQQFLPTVVKEGDAYHARWLPVFAGAEAERLQRLAQAMPQVCRALSDDASQPPAAPAVAVLSEFVGQVVDHLARTSDAGTSSTGKQSTGKRSTGKRSTRKQSFDTLHDQWLHALRGEVSELQGGATELAQLAAQARDWRRPVDISASTAFRLCFRLEEPPPPDEEIAVPPRRAAPAPAWYVRYLLQAADDPSLMIPVADAWAAKGKQATALKRGGFNPREYLLSSLGQAAGISPRIEQSLQAAAPAGYELDATNAFAFLNEQAWLLEQSGYRVLLPAWWTRKGTKLRLSVRANVKAPKMQASSGFSLSDIFNFNYEVALGDEVLSLEELEALAKLKEPLVRIRGQWVQLSADEIQTAIEFWKRKAEGQATARELVQMALGAGKDVKGMAFEGITATGWLGDMLAQLEGRAAFRELEVAASFNGTLRPYQTRGYSWLAFLRQLGFGACLADDMGMGKGVQMLTMIQRDWHADENGGAQRPVLLVCPMSVVGNWEKEAARFTPDLPVMVHHGVTRAKGAAFKEEAAQQAVVISSYSLLHRDFDLLNEVDWQGVVLDEAQNIKNAETKQSKAARALKSEYRVALTGTPVENNIGDLWSLMEFLNPGFLGTQAEFKRRYFVPIQTQREAEATARLKRVTGPFILRRLKTDKSIIADLPEKMEMKVYCTLTKEQASLYEAVVRDTGNSLDDAEGIQRKGLVLATLMKLKQVCNHPAQFLGDNSALAQRSGKLARLTEMLEEVFATGERALVFTQFAEMGTMMQRHLQETFGREVLFLYGATAKQKRDRMVERFQAVGDDAPRVFILSVKAGGTGLNLTAANHVFHFDRWWNPAVENQATDRAFRIGQQRNVQVHKFICAGTLEEKIDEMIERKQEVAASIVGTGEGWLTELSTKELKELFALRADAVGE